MGVAADDEIQSRARDRQRARIPRRRAISKDVDQVRRWEFITISEYEWKRFDNVIRYRITESNNLIPFGHLIKNEASTGVNRKKRNRENFFEPAWMKTRGQKSESAAITPELCGVENRDRSTTLWFGKTRNARRAG
ncbi:hypothetical protein AAGT95_13300 [Salinicola lusitanus]|uniref:Uncharacterized protein n=1 Tax=Salinicola lusitanus TaxID=1949085 RepID=A0ABZ3CNU7_9GAMM